MPRRRAAALALSLSLLGGCTTARAARAARIGVTTGLTMTVTGLLALAASGSSQGEAPSEATLFGAALFVLGVPITVVSLVALPFLDRDPAPIAPERRAPERRAPERRTLPQVLHRLVAHAATAARAGDCATVRKIGIVVMGRSPPIYWGELRADVAIRRCYEPGAPRPAPKPTPIDSSPPPTEPPPPPPLEPPPTTDPPPPQEPPEG